MASRLRSLALLFTLLLAGGQPAFSQDALPSSGSNTDTLSSPGVVVQDEFLRVEEAYILSVSPQAEQIMLHWDIEPKYYLYKDNFRVNAYDSEGTALPVELEYLQQGEVKYDDYFEKDMEVFYNFADVRVTFPAGSSPAELSITSQGCADAGLCYPPYTEYYKVDMGAGTAAPIDQLSAKMAAGANAGGVTGAPAAAFDPAYLAYVLLLAVLGGIILNAMPCVFPVLSIKALSFASARGSDHSHHVHGWAYTIGAVTTFLVIGGIIVGIRAAGGDADWGRQLQSPLFVTAMFYLFLVMGLSLSGFIHFGSQLMGVGQSLTTRQGLQGSFFTGALAVVVASPCTAPLMATALGATLTQPAPIALAIFAALGFGMALPFLLLSYSPKLASFLPKPGAWMDTLKQFLAFPLYLTAVWLLWVLGRQSGVDAAAAIALGAVAIGFGFWLLQKLPRGALGQWVFRGMAAAVFVGALVLALKADEFGKDDFWRPYSPELVADLRNRGQPVFVNLTAAWCITCHANERVALNREAVKLAAAELNIAMIKGDWTNEDPRITALMHEYRRSGVPLYLMFPADPNQPAEILPQILTVDTVVDAMERAAGTEVAVAL